MECCRACLSTTSATYIDMTAAEENGRDGGLLESFLRLLSSDDCLQLPSTICTSCQTDLQAAIRFIKVAKQADAVLRANLRTKVSEEHEEDDPEMRFEEEEEECVLECQLEDDGGGDEMEFMEVEAVEEQIVDCIEDSQYEPEEKPEFEQFIVEESVTSEQQQQKLQIKEEQQWNTSAIEYYAEDELDDEYLLEYSEQLEEASTKATNNAEETSVKASSSGVKWKCFVCKRVLRGDVVYEGHMNLHQHRRPYKCVQCPGAFRCRNALERHEKLRHKAGREEEEALSDSGINNNNNDEEVEDEEEKELTAPTTTTTTIVWQCDICKRQLRSETALQAHHKTHLNERPHGCSVCGKRFASTYTLRTHMRNLHLATEADEKDGGGGGGDLGSGVEDDGEVGDTGDTLVQCQLCEKQVLRQNLAKHAALHARKQQKFLCSHCPRECKSRKVLHQHEKMHDGETPGIVFICADCDREYSTQHLLELHRKQAHKERDNICPICGNAFKLKNQLVNHMKLHLEKNIQCPQCEKRYARQFDLNVHLRSHTGELPFACHMCEKRFAIKVRLTYHLQKHLGIKHACKECGAEFNSKQKLKSHSFKHSGMPYRCEMCDDHGFANRDVFKRHLMRVHHATMSDEALVEMFQRNTGKTTRIRPINEMEHVVVRTHEVAAEERQQCLINDEDIAMESEVVHT